MFPVNSITLLLTVSSGLRLSEVNYMETTVP